MSMNSNLGWYVILAVVVLWIGSKAWGDYTNMRTNIAKYEADAKFYDVTIKGIRDLGVASAEVNKEALARAIERLAEREER